MKPQIKMVALVVAVMATPVASASCGAAGLQPDHIVVVVEENHGFSDIIGNPNAPFINTLASEGLLFTKFYGIGRPSQVNYFALFSGATHGIADNEAHTISAPTLADQLKSAGLRFVGYGEAGAERKHKPWESFVSSRRHSRDFKSFPKKFDQLPTVAFVTPNLSHNMHDGTIKEGDRWLRKHLEPYVNWAKRHNSLFILTFDEDGGHDDHRVPLIVVGAGIKPGMDDTLGDHYSLLRTIQSRYGLASLTRSTTAPLLAIVPAKSKPLEALSAK